MVVGATRLTLKNLLPLLFVAATIVVIWTVYVSFHLLPLLQLDKPAEKRDAVEFRRGVIEAVISQVLTVLLLACYARCVLTDPGSVPEDPEWLPDGPEEVQVPRLREVKLTSGLRRHCKWCGRWKPDRCHHCRICKRCVLKMDHHCRWIMNCVGFHNHKYFFLVVVYSALDCLFITMTMVESIQRAEITEMPFANRFLVVFAMTISLFLGFILSMFLVFHTWLAMHNTTTIEFCEKALARGTMSAYDCGPLRNIYTLFGPKPLFWLLPFSPPEGDGVRYQTLAAHDDALLERKAEPEWTGTKGEVTA